MRSAIVTGIAALAVISACSQPAPTPDPTASQQPATTAPSSPTESAPPQPSPSQPDPTPAQTPFPGSPATTSSDGAGPADLVLIDVRVGQHLGYDRLVLEFTGSGTPGWNVGYVDEAIADGSGQTISVEGEAILNVVATNTTYPPTADDYYPGPQQFEPESQDIEDIYVAGVFEGQTRVVAGIDDGPTPFQVFTLTDPARLVIDLQTSAQ